MVQKRDFAPNIDLFASRLNYQIKPFVSYLGDPESATTDALSLPSWSTWVFYAFPPFSIISLVLQMVITDKSCGIIFVPNWPTQSWYPTIKRLLLKHAVLSMSSSEPCTSRGFFFFFFVSWGSIHSVSNR